MGVTEDIKEIQDSLIKEFFVKSDDDVESPLLGYHYTSMETAKNIIKSQSLRFTNARYLNDPKELDDGLDIARDAFNSVCGKLVVRKENKAAFFIASVMCSVELALRKPSERQDVMKYWHKRSNTPKELYKICLLYTSPSPRDRG